MTWDTLIQEVRELPPDKRKELVMIILDSFSQQSAHKRSILEFEGVGAHLRDEVDPQEYINQLRDEWDRPE